MAVTNCSVTGCERAAFCRGWCGMHYQRWRATGDPTATLPRGKASAVVEERFWALVERHGPDDCWPWIGALNNKGYGNFMMKVGGRWTTRRAHRIAYELCVGPIPPGLEIDHVRARGCSRRDCVNPAHLEPVTHAENARRGEPSRHNARKTHCKHGHEFTPENTYRRGGRRYCRACSANNLRAFRRRSKAARKAAA
jgi:HNH endonuclease